MSRLKSDEKFRCCSDTGPAFSGFGSCSVS